MSFFNRYGAETVRQTVKDYLTSDPGRARKARSVGLEDVVQETMVNLLRYPPKRDVLLLNGCYWTASYTLRRMINKRRPVSPAGLFYNVPDEYDEDMEELWVAVRRLLNFKLFDPLYRFYHGESQISIAADYAVHQSVICMRMKTALARLRHEPSKGIQFFLTGERYV